ncbi:hypothetical protein [Marinomonas primoryensis]|jgi:hypothetical protein|uniref:hypothetical protein n=1 Tax=Marinomonas primoryensis TaxID=178399 RepID=UPI00370453A2
MKFQSILCTSLMLCSVSIYATELNHWPESVAEELNTMIEKNANTGAYAVFDMDNTSYQYDIEESLLPYLEMKRDFCMSSRFNNIVYQGSFIKNSINVSVKNG